jgi:hypothetical protein
LAPLYPLVGPRTELFRFSRQFLEEVFSETCGASGHKKRARTVTPVP